MKSSRVTQTFLMLATVSGHAISRNIKNGLATLFFHYLTKPIQVHKLLNIFNEVMQFAEKELSSSKTLGALDNFNADILHKLKETDLNVLLNLKQRYQMK